MPLSVVIVIQASCRSMSIANSVVSCCGNPGHVMIVEFVTPCGSGIRPTASWLAERVRVLVKCCLMHECGFAATRAKSVIRPGGFQKLRQLQR